MTRRYMLDTNTVSHLLRNHPQIHRHLASVPMAAICISAVTEGELLFGLAKRPEARHLQRIVREFLVRVERLPWDSKIAETYGDLRAETTRQGRTLSPLDLLIAAHALSVNAILVTSDKAFGQLDRLAVEDWISEQVDGMKRE